MKFLLPFLLCLSCYAATLDDYADAIFVTEGGPRARVPYGILSVKVRDASEARAVCVRTVAHSLARWQAAGQPGDFVDWLAATYCPASADPVGNRNWRRNMRMILEKQAKRPIKQAQKNLK